MNNSALAGLWKFYHIMPQGFVRRGGLHLGLWVRRPFRTMDGIAPADFPDPSVTLRFTQGFGSGQDQTGGTLTFKKAQREKKRSGQEGMF